MTAWKHITQLLIIVIAAGIARAEDPDTYPEISTSSGKTYKQVTIKTVTPTHLHIIHSAGAARVPLEELAHELRAKYGYTPEKAAAYEKSRAERAAARLRQKRHEEKLAANLLVIERATVFQIQEEGVLAKVWATWDGKSYRRIPQKDAKEGTKTVKDIKEHGGWLVFIRCDSSNLTDGQGISGKSWRHGRFTYTNLLGQTRALQRFTLNPDDLLQERP